jgi:hypothetical protein
VLAQREGDVVVEVHRAEQRAVLEQDAELLAHLEQLVVGHARHGLAVHEHVARRRDTAADHVLDADRLPVPDGPRIIEILSSGMPRLRPRRILLRPNALCTRRTRPRPPRLARRPCASGTRRPRGPRSPARCARSAPCRALAPVGWAALAADQRWLRSSATVTSDGLAGSRPRRSGCRACR